MPAPEIVSQDEWETARRKVFEQEDAVAIAWASLAAERRRMPMIRVDKDYRFQGPDGEVGLRDLISPSSSDSTRAQGSRTSSRPSCVPSGGW